MLRPITVVGGGIAGLALGILLRREDVPVEIWEAGHYPRHRVCGEFICGQGVQILHQLPLLSPPPLFQPQTVRFLTHSNRTRPFRIPGPAIAISRFELDHALAATFRHLGGHLRDNTRWADPFGQEGVVRASGRRIAKDDKYRLIGIKVHALDLQLAADLELHFSPSGYIGLAKLPNGVVNICALLRTRNPIANIRETVADRLAEIANSEFRPIIRNSRLDPSSLCVVAGLSMQRDPAVFPTECRIGDSIRMISPLSGNGMSLAIESAQLAAPLLERYSRGKLDWDNACRLVSQACENTFNARLRISSILQRCLFSSAGQSAFRWGIDSMSALFPLLFRTTRS